MSLLAWLHRFTGRPDHEIQKLAAKVADWPKTKRGRRRLRRPAHGTARPYRRERRRRNRVAARSRARNRRAA
jgi:hypothetical protein